MSEKTVLVIDDSATIRKLVDNTLSPNGYVVVLAANAEDGLRIAGEVSPDMILLDHQLPGTTGFEVATKLADMADLCRVPVVISSTLRNKAYMEYSELPNVVDMLPKPYAAELLVTTVANAVETGAMVVQSQTSGTAVPEVINDVDAADLQGSMNIFTIREVLDLLNNGEKTGVLEVQADHVRTWFYLKNGRIQGVTANSHDQDALLQFLPDALQDLAPVLELAAGRGMMGQVDGLVQLLNRKVLDPRLLGKLLRYHAALLVFRCFTQKLDGFRFEANKTGSPLFERLPLDLSLLALLVDAATQCDESELPDDSSDFVYTRRVIRGQNLDRTGLAARQIQLLKFLSEPHSLEDLAKRTGWEPIEIRRVLFGMTMADLVSRHQQSRNHTVVALEPNPVAAQQLRGILTEADTLTAKVVRDRLALQLVLRRTTPDVVVFAADSEEAAKFAVDLKRSDDNRFANTRWVAINEGPEVDLEITPDAVVCRSMLADELLATIESMFGESRVDENAETLSLGAN